MARKPSYSPTSMADAVNPPHGPEPTKPQANETPAKRTPAARTPARAGKRGVAFWLTPQAFKVLRQISVDDDQPIQSLMEEATDLLFRARGHHPIARQNRDAA